MVLHSDTTNSKSIKAFQGLEERFKIIHNDKYNYENSIYTKMTAIIEIYCKKHGIFSQRPSTHLNGFGCIKCGRERNAEKSRSTIEEFITKAKKVHGRKYDYSKVIYVSSSKDVKIICPEYGEFLQTPDRHLRGHGPKIGASKIIGAMLRKTTKQFITEANIKHKNLFTYENAVYTGSKSIITITCGVHGDFTKVAASHLAGSKCPNCIGRVLDTENFILKAKTVHNNSYSYNSVIYKRTNEKVTITCKIHGDFEQSPAGHLVGHGCPTCAPHGFNKNTKATLYYFKVTDGTNTAWKIGITNRSVKLRYSLEERNRISEVQTKAYLTGAEALIEEQKMLEKYKQYRYNGPDLLTIGNTELFNIDIFNKDN